MGVAGSIEKKNMLLRDLLFVRHKSFKGLLRIQVPSGKLTWLENCPFEDVFPIENGDFFNCHVSLPELEPFYRILGMALDS